MTRRVAVGLALRVVLVTACLAVLPHIFSDDVRFLWSRTHGMSLHNLPYRDFLWEYPPLSLVPMLLAVFTSATAFSVLFGLMMGAAEMATLELLRRHHPDRSARISAYWYAVALPLSTIAYFRLDWLPVLFATSAFVAIAGGRSGWPAVTAGFAAKLWPVTTVVMLALGRRYRQMAMAIAGVVGVLAAWYAFSPEGFRTFLRFRRGSGFQVESVVGSVSLMLGSLPSVVSNSWVVNPGRWGWVDPAMTLAWLALVAAVVVVGRRRHHDPVLLVGGLVTALLLSSRLLSPQFLVWPVPFVALAWAQRDRVCGLAFATATAITLLAVYRYDELLFGGPALPAAMVVRNVLLLVVMVRLLSGGLRPPAGAVGAPEVPAIRSVPKQAAMAGT